MAGRGKDHTLCAVWVVKEEFVNVEIRQFVNLPIRQLPITNYQFANSLIHQFANGLPTFALSAVSE